MIKYACLLLVGMTLSTTSAYAASYETLSTPDGVEYGYQEGAKGKPLLIVITTDIAESLTDKYSSVSATMRNSGYSLVAIDSTCHGKDVRKKERSGLACWNNRASSTSSDIFDPYITNLKSVVGAVKSKGVADVTAISVLGVSRGGYLAFKAAEQISEIQNVIALAPVTDIFSLSEFSGSTVSRQIYSLEDGYSILAKKHVFIQINNQDDRVGTAQTVSLITEVTKAGGSEAVDLTAVITPKRGHSTSEHQMAAQWALSRQDFARNDAQTAAP